MPHIASTLSCDQSYNFYKPVIHEGKSSGVNIIDKQVLIRGGANVASKRHLLLDNVLTAEAVLTEVSDAALELLLTDEVFQTHVNSGFIKVLNQKTTAEKAAKDMEKRDESAPLIAGDERLRSALDVGIAGDGTKIIGDRMI